MEDLNDKVTGGTLTADEWNQVPSEIQNVITKAGQGLSGGDLSQLGKGVASLVGSGDAYVDSGIVNALDLVPISTNDAPPAYRDQMRIRTLVGVTNTGAVTINVAGLGIKDLVDQFNSALASGDLVAGTRYEFYYNAANDNVVYDKPSATPNILPPGFKDGLVLSMNTVSPLEAIDIAAGSCKDDKSSGGVTDMTLTAALGKDISLPWAEGGTPGVPAGGFPSLLTLTADTWYHVFAIRRATGQVDAGFDTSPGAANLLADATDYSEYRRIGSIFVWDNGGNLEYRKFIQKQKTFWFADDDDADLFRMRASDVLSAVPSSTTNIHQFTDIPPGFECEAIFAAALSDSTTSDNASLQFSHPDGWKSWPSAVNSPLAGNRAPAGWLFNQDGQGSAQGQNLIYCPTDTAQQVRYGARTQAGGAITTVSLYPFGWTDYFGGDG